MQWIYHWAVVQPGSLEVVQPASLDSLSQGMTATAGQNTCDTLGADGWELVSAFPLAMPTGGAPWVHLLFKRPAS
jgi:hypothetical protein